MTDVLFLSTMEWFFLIRVLRHNLSYNKKENKINFISWSFVNLGTVGPYRKYSKSLTFTFKRCGYFLNDKMFFTIKCPVMDIFWNIKKKNFTYISLG